MSQEPHKKEDDIVQENKNINDNEDKFLVYNIQGQLYASPLLSIREVIKMTTIRPLPYMKKYFKGVLNLRGQIVGVIDLRLKFGHKIEPDSGLIVILDTVQGPIGAVVDDIVSVEGFEVNQIEKNPKLDTQVPLEFFDGVAKSNDRLIHIINIANCLSSEELRQIKKVA